MKKLLALMFANGNENLASYNETIVGKYWPKFQNATAELKVSPSEISTAVNAFALGYESAKEEEMRQQRPFA